MKILVLGGGSIGQRHISNLVKIISRNCIYLYDVEKNQLDFVSKKFKINSTDQLIYDAYDCLFICTPPSTHISLAINALKCGCHVFIEKPLSSNSKGISLLQKLAKKKNLLVFVGYTFRFNSGLNNIKKILQKKQLGKPLSVSAYFGQYLPDWRPKQNYKKNYSAIKRLGGGIIHDSSHEIDYLIWLFGNPKEIQSNYVTTDIIKTDVEGIAEIILKFKNNLLGTIHLDFIRREYRRSVEILCENGILFWSLKENKIKIFNSKNNKWLIYSTKENTNDMYVQEIKHVLHCIKQKKPSNVIGLDNGINSHKFSNLIIKSGKTGKRLSV
ncbi:oxidoreductase, NAD-binding domain protein [Candidatus Nitrosopumilus salaria BD31]|uniref:Oxidoreductase, NAD-binding domain protein n=1 Tax=Candidatus Nitrosopumilus salarius BD31 TaxID=859350 RepID=I3D5F0_9ARCH|nr:Gfo/Idh/MocA family oxidoreductase [Candidatus Nitrosopumilus salaria]EIJ66943.1 oxidoreductase, NAD-binding domain protein [Candidatus Nitrosopumilus salaria BD31]